MSELLLLSGGIDSIALAAWRRPAVCLTVHYGQRPALAEIRSSERVCQELGLHHEILDIPLRSIGSGLLAGLEHVPASTNPEFWPFRNQFLITLGAMAAMRHCLNKVVIGTVRSDRRHKDGSVQFVEAMGDLLALQEGSIALEAPAMHLSSTELVRTSGVTVELLGWAHSCHTAEMACGQCPGCNKHSEIMQALGLNR